MAQTTLNIYAADQIFKCVPHVLLRPLLITVCACSYVTRLGGTLLGLALGLVGWYAGQLPVACTSIRTERDTIVGNGNGNGNPYGAAAAFGVVVFPLVFLRVFSPELYLAGNVMCCVRSIPSTFATT